MSDLPYLQSYVDPKKQRAYERYMRGDSQRGIAAALNLNARTIANWSIADGWEGERKARGIGPAQAPNVAAVAAADAKASDSEPRLSRAAGMEKMLERQQLIAGRLVAAYELDVDKAFGDAAVVGRQVTRTQIAQLTILGNNVLALERKAWCVPDKIETKDTTPTQADRVRQLSDDQLNDRIAAARERRLEAERRRGAPADRGGSAEGGVN